MSFNLRFYDFEGDPSIVFKVYEAETTYSFKCFMVLSDRHKISKHSSARERTSEIWFSSLNKCPIVMLALASEMN